MRTIAALLLAISATPTASLAAASTDVVRMAVLPFEAIDRPATDATRAVAQQVTEGLRQRLARDPAIEMISDERLSSMASDTDPGRAAQQFDADLVVTGYTIMGSTSGSDQVLRINYQLFVREMGTEVWSQAFDQDYAQVERMLDGTATAIRRAIPQQVLAARAPASGLQPLPITPPSVPPSAAEEPAVEMLSLIVVPDIDHASDPGGAVASAIADQLIMWLSEDALFDVAPLAESMAAADRHETAAAAAATLGHDIAMMLTVVPDGRDFLLSYDVAQASGRSITYASGIYFVADGYNADIGVLTQEIAEDVGRMTRRRYTGAPAASAQPLPIAPPSRPLAGADIGRLVVVPAYSDRSEAGTNFASAITDQAIRILRDDHGIDVADLSESMSLAAGRFDSPMEIVNSRAHDYQHALVLELTSPPEVSVYAIYFRGSDGVLWQEGYAASRDMGALMSDLAANVAGVIGAAPSDVGAARPPHPSDRMPTESDTGQIDDHRSGAASQQGQRTQGAQQRPTQTGSLDSRPSRQGQRTGGSLQSDDDRRLTPVDPPRLSRPEEEQMLVDAGMDRSDARLWLNEGFTAYDVMGWRPFVNSYRHSGRSNLQEATNWWRWGWTPEQAEYFMHELCGRYRQAAAQANILSPAEIIERFGDQCRR
jgi:TolB-like protein